MHKTLTILYVDDEPINLMLFAENFGKSRKILTASSGQEGLDILRSNTDVSIVISDFKMPEMNGVQFIKIAKKEFPDIIFYILTGYDINDEIEDCLNNKIISDYFSKPFNRSAIEAALS